jgi:hypothetical protein
MPEQPERQRITALRARAALFRQAASYISLRSDRGDLESYAAELEKQADRLEEQLRANAAVQAEGTAEPPSGPEALAAMKKGVPDEPTMDEQGPELALNEVAALFAGRVKRLRELSEHITGENKQLLLDIAEEYEQIANKLTAPK